MTPAVLEPAIVGGSLAAGAVATSVALRAVARARADRLALRLARAREAMLADAARRLAEAARDSVDAVRDEIARSVRVAAPALDGVLLYEEHEGALACVYAEGERVAYFAGSRIALDDAGALPAHARASGHRVTLDAPGMRPLHPGDASALAVPLVLGGGRACVLAVCARVGLAAETIERLVALAELASPAYAVALDREGDRRRAEYDGLTGLLTPRAFRARLAALIERARLTPAATHALLFLDSDKFKQWNDAYGHASGDALLREIARILRAAAHEGDLVARNGGDEFCVVFAGADKATAIERAETLRRRIAEADFSALHATQGHENVRISASIGVAAYPADAASAHALLEHADAAMYHSKHTGRDGVSYAGVDGAYTRLSSVPV